MISVIKESVAGALMFGAGMIVDEKSLVPLGVAAASGVTLFWIGRKIQRIDDQLERVKIIDDRVVALSEQVTKMSDLAVKIEDLPCKKDDVCKFDDPKKLKSLKMI
jgi:hypothetical protein